MVNGLNGALCKWSIPELPRLGEGDEPQTKEGIIFVSWKNPKDDEDEGTWDVFGVRDWRRVERDVTLE